MIVPGMDNDISIEHGGVTNRRTRTIRKGSQRYHQTIVSQHRQKADRRGYHSEFDMKL